MELTTAMLADGAHLAQGKLYILGGQWDRIMVGQFPAHHPSMAVALVIRVEYSEAPKSFALNIELMLDGKPLGVRTVGRLSIGHAAGLAHGAPQFAPVAATFNNVQFEHPGRYEFVISADTQVLGQIPLEVAQAAGAPIVQPPAPPNREDE
jgi:hypothetical protein